MALVGCETSTFWDAATRFAFRRGFNLIPLPLLASGGAELDRPPIDELSLSEDPGIEDIFGQLATKSFNNTYYRPAPLHSGWLSAENEYRFYY